MKIRVYYEDTDAGGIVYHTNYIKYCERARSEAFFERGLTPFDGEDSGFIVKDLKCSFLASSKLSNLLDVTTRVLKLRGSSMLLLQEIYHDEVKVFSMEIMLVFVKSGKPSRIPKVYKEFLAEYLI